MGGSRELLRGRRILFVFGCLHLGGSERQGLHLARYLKDACQADVRVLALSREPGRVAELCDEYGIPWEGVPFRWSRFHLQRLLALHRLTAYLRKVGAEVLLPYYSLPNTVCGLVWQKAAARACIWNQRDHGLLLTRGSLHRTAVRQVSAFIANSECGMDFLQQTYGSLGREVHLIHNGIVLPPAAADRQQWRDRLGLAPDDFVACMIANLGPYKDHGSLVRAWQGIAADAASRGRRAVLLLAGKGDGREKALNGLIDQLALGDTVRLLGMVADVSGLLQASDLYVHCSLREGSPNAVLEAMAAGLPVVGTDIPGIREAVGPQGVPFLSPLGDPAGMASAIGLLMADGALRQSIGEALRRRVEQEFSLERMCTASAKVITAALAAAMDPRREM